MEAQQDPFRLGDRVIHPDLGQIVGPQGVVEVEPKTMAVLLCLAAHGGGVVSADDLIEAIWQSRPMGDNTIYNCISKLRKALGDTARQCQYIATVPKKGYRLLRRPRPLSGASTDNVPPSPDGAMTSIAVLPFTSLSGQAEHRFLAIGIAAELHSSLSKVHRLRVASHHTCVSTDIARLSTQELAQRLRVQYLLSGTVHCVDDRMHLIVELDDANEDTQLWSRTFDGHVGDVLALQHDIATAIVGEFCGERLRAEIVRASGRLARDLDAWSLVQKARAYVLDYSCAALDRALSLLERAINRYPDSAAVRAALGAILCERILNGISSDAINDERIARDIIACAQQLSPHDPFVLKMCGSAWAFIGEPARSIASLRRAAQVAPFDFGAWGRFGWPLTATGVKSDLDELHGILDRIIDAAPTHPGIPYWQYHKSVACTCQGRTEHAVTHAAESVGRNGGFSMAWTQYANALGVTGDADTARAAAGRGTDVNPAMTPEHYAAMIIKMSAGQDFVASRLAGLRAAGLLLPMTA